MKKQKRLCHKCINFIYEDTTKTKIICDFGHFQETNIEKAMLFTPELFDCIVDYETLKD